MIPSPIVKVLSTIRKHGVKALLMGGQACVFYGAAEFSRDADLLIVTDPDNLDRLRAALNDLQARQVFVPALQEDFLRRGHAVHFKCGIPEANDIRIDVMGTLRGVGSFAELWERRSVIEDKEGNIYDLLSLGDLVLAKKTQRDKDWPMVTRLIEANYFANRDAPSEEQLRFWFQEMRTPEYLIHLSQQHPSPAQEMHNSRPLLLHAISGDVRKLADALDQEQRIERERDREYWQPLKRELEQLRRNRV